MSRMISSPIFFPDLAGSSLLLSIMNGASFGAIVHTGGQYGFVLPVFSVTLREGPWPSVDYLSQ